VLASQIAGTGPQRIHFVGIGGTAMVAGARLAVEAGCEVRGSDNALYPPTSEMVAALGVPVATAYAAENLYWRPDVVVIGNALSRGNPEVEAVLERKLHYVSLPEWLKDAVLRARRPVVVCGTHGKTTTTALAAFLLDRAGLEPGFLVGGQPLDFPYSARLGAEGAPFVIEGDEYDTAFFDKRSKFFHYLPEIAVVTSIEFDHADIFDDVAEIERAFQLMLRLVPRSGCTLLCADDARALALKDHAHSRVVTYGFTEDADWRIERLGYSKRGLTRAAVYRDGRPFVELDVPLAGRHNLQNVVAAVTVASLLGAAPDDMKKALPGFRGVRRRIEVFLEAKGVTFIDDFAHHPTAIRETIQAAREQWCGRSMDDGAGASHRGGRLWVLFEPRSNTTVTNRFQRELEDAFACADEVWLGPLYRPERVAPASRLDREGLVRALATHRVAAHCAADASEIVEHVADNAWRGDVVLVLSNGAFDGIHDKLREAFSSEQSLDQ